MPKFTARHNKALAAIAAKTAGILPFALPAGTYTIKARAYARGYSPSDVATSAEFTVQPPEDNP